MIRWLILEYLGFGIMQISKYKNIYYKLNSG